MTVLRLCAGYDRLPREQCAVPGRCLERHCSHCGQLVHYDPKATIPVLGAERIICGACFDSPRPCETAANGSGFPCTCDFDCLNYWLRAWTA